MPGTLVIKPLLANLDNDLEVELADNVNPYCVVSLGDKKVTGPTCKKGGKYPFWKGTFLLPRENEHFCFIEIKNKQLAPHQIIGVSEINIDEVADKGKVTKWYDVYFHKKPAGKIFVEAAFENLVKPEQFLDYNEPEGENSPPKEGLGANLKEEPLVETESIPDRDKILLREDKLGLLENMDLEAENLVSNENARPKNENQLLKPENLFVIKEVSRDSIGNSEPTIRSPYILEEKLIDDKIKDGGNESF
jgi:hypothetical protein